MVTWIACMLVREFELLILGGCIYIDYADMEGIIINAWRGPELGALFDGKIIQLEDNKTIIH
jgi:hypothetical protein